MIVQIDQQSKLRTVYCSATDSPHTADEIFAFRKKILVDKLGWKLRVADNKEQDEFDTGQAIYGAIYADNEIMACFRLMRTDQPYLARSKFPFLASKYSYPDSPLVWEISRLAVSEKSRPFEMMLYAYSAIFHFAREVGAVSLVAFAEVAKERLVSRIGITTKLLGRPHQIGQDAFGRAIICVAGELPLRAQSGARFNRLISYIDKTEIEDATTLLRRPSISARSA